MKSFKQHIAEKHEIGPGSRVIINQSRFRSGRDPGRKLERLTGTVKRIREDGHCFVEFDRHVAINGKKVKSMQMNSSYLDRLDEDTLNEIGYTRQPGSSGNEPIGRTLTASAKNFATSTDQKGKEIKGMPRKHFNPKGEAQTALGGWVANQSKGKSFQLSDVHRMIKPRISHFAKLQSAANTMAKKGLLDFDGLSKITIR